MGYYSKYMLEYKLEKPNRWINKKITLDWYKDINVLIYKLEQIYYRSNNSKFVDFIEQVIKHMPTTCDIYEIYEYRSNDYEKLLSLNYDDYNENNFSFNKNIKILMFLRLVEICDELIENNQYSNRTNIGLRNIKNYILEEIIKNDNCDMDNVLYMIIPMLIKNKFIMIGNIDYYNNNLDTIYTDVIHNCFNDIYSMNIINFITFFDCMNEDLNGEIFKILYLLTYNKMKMRIIKGGNNITFNNSLIKKILIVLLIVVIIIIIVLIVLFIINKYKNNNKFK